MALKANRRGLAANLVTAAGKLKAGAISIADASTTVKGLVKIGSGLNVSDGTISIADASTTVKGLVKIGSGLNVSDGTVSVADPLPAHAAAQAGKILSVDDDGDLVWSDPPSGGRVNILDATLYTGFTMTASGIRTSSDSNIYVVPVNGKNALIEFQPASSASGTFVTGFCDTAAPTAYVTWVTNRTEHTVSSTDKKYAELSNGNTLGYLYFEYHTNDPSLSSAYTYAY